MPETSSPPAAVPDNAGPDKAGPDSDAPGDYQPSAADLAWARGLVEDPCAALPPVVLQLPAAAAAGPAGEGAD